MQLMERAVSDKNILRRFCNEFCPVIEKYTHYMIVAGFLAIATGRTRGTEDIDMIAGRMDKPHFVQMHKNLTANGFVCMQSDDPGSIYDDYLAENVGVRYTWKDMPVPEMEMKFAKDRIDELGLRERVKIPLTNLEVWFAPVEMNIAFKEEYLKSDKDMEDARHLRLIFSGEISEERVKCYKGLIRQVRP